MNQVSRYKEVKSRIDRGAKPSGIGTSGNHLNLDIVFTNHLKAALRRSLVITQHHYDSELEQIKRETTSASNFLLQQSISIKREKTEISKSTGYFDKTTKAIAHRKKIKTLNLDFIHSIDEQVKLIQETILHCQRRLHKLDGPKKFHPRNVKLFQ